MKRWAWIASGCGAAALMAGVAIGEYRPDAQAAPGAAPRMGVAPPRALAMPAFDAATLMPNTQALFTSYVRDNKLPGIVGAFGRGDNPTLFVAAGHISDDPGARLANADSLWRVYSMTKPITATAAMILLDEGKLRLDDPVAKFIPGFAHMKVLTSPGTSLASRPATRPITIRNLLTHTAGLGYNIVTKGPLLHEYERLGILPAAINAPVEAQMRRARPASLQEFARRVATLPLIADPGTKWSYSIGLDVMGAVIERASGMPFDAFVQARIFDPLHMRSSFWTVPKGEAGRLATNYVFTGTARAALDPGATSVWLRPPSFPYGGAGLVMSARDYDTFLHMLQDRGTLNGATIIKPATAALMMSNLLPPGVTFGGVGGSTGGTNASVPMGYGAGGSVYLADGPGGFPGKGTYGWGGAAGTIAFVDPAKNFRGTVMVNYFPADRWPLRQQMVAALAQDSARLHALATPPR